MQTRRSLIRNLLAGAAIALALPVFAQTAGKDYIPVEPPQATDNPSKIEVIEFFSYGCPHCNEFHPLISEWVAKLPADVQFRRVPVSFGRAAWANLSRLYYTLEATGDLAKLDGSVFRTIHEERGNLFDDKAIADWVASKGVDGKKFSDAFGSFGVMSKAKRGDQVAGAFRIQGIPAIAVEGKYMVSARDFKEMLAITDKLIAKARAERGKK